ncbi:MBL fold metallo-hydrolase [Micrococcus sp. TA1]|uniref:MBL fold metallo-hydrolase n=1 Tax=Micrococcus sp. TA1 TaxID=681627 RepID=UPI0017E6D4B0|nr:MBL fold metallo-hydrolase [Micrococcus sp. TA1]MBB5750021.1 ribonuclease BN (tRNA processing enzyme) [Micrococcus sp. TA1]
MASTPRSPRPSRRAILGAGGAMALGAPFLAAGGASADETPVLAAPGKVPEAGMHLVTLGTAAGPAIRGSRHGISSAVIVDGLHYLVDFGLGMPRQVSEAGLTGSTLRQAFVTHLHSDHVSELSAYMLYNWDTPVQGVTSRVGIMGPGRARLPQGFRPVVEPSQTGMKDVVDHLLKANGYDINIRTTDEARIPLDELFEGVDIDLPRGLKADPDRHPVPEMEPFTIYEDDRVRVQATLVEHLPVFPSFGFRFESDHGVISFSGDTAEHSNVARLSRDADIMVHEVINMDYYRDRGFTEEYLHHLESSHTSPEGIGRIATEAGAKSVVVSHVAGVFSHADLTGIGAHYDGSYTLAADRQIFSL